MIHLLRSKPTKKQVDEMLETLEYYIKLAVDIERGILAGGGVLHADCETVLLNDGSLQQNIWGADWIPDTKQIRYEALINIRPDDENPSMEILNPEIRKRIEEIVKQIMSSHNG